MRVRFPPNVGPFPYPANESPSFRVLPLTAELALTLGSPPVSLLKTRSLRDPRGIARLASPGTRLSTTVAARHLLANVSPPGTAAGCVIAAPSRDPATNYFYHWVRDAALVMDVILELAENTSDPAERESLLGHLRDYAAFSRQNQLAKTLTGLGEPKFEADGRRFNGPWGRPQDDGPALRAMTLMRFCRLAGDDPEIVETVRADLEYVAARRNDASFDLWEEVKGLHFYTTLVQIQALREGEAFLRERGLAAFADVCRSAVSVLKSRVEKHWDEDRGHFAATVEAREGKHKPSRLDASVILAVLHAPENGAVGLADDRVQATVQKIIDVSRALYPINRPELPGTVIGRYPEDEFMGGNPWVLLTCALGEYYRRLAAAYARSSGVAVTGRNERFLNHVLNEAGSGFSVTDGEFLGRGSSRFRRLLAALKLAGGDQIRRVHYHANEDGSLSEQINKYSGHMHGAPRLTWSYAAYLSSSSP